MSANPITESAPAKINLGLAITRKRGDGFHNLISVFQTVSWADQLEFTDAHDILLTCSDLKLTIGPDNLVLRAAELVRTRFQVHNGAHIHLRKSIPWGAGLGGGSSDAAATLRGLARLWNIDALTATWLELCAQLGSDVPFFFRGGTAVVTGRGEHVDSLPDDITKDSPTFVIAVPNVSVSTPWAFRTLAAKYAGSFPNAEEYRQHVTALHHGDMTFREFITQLDEWNTFQTVVEAHHPEIARVRRQLRDSGAIVALMSGSGSAVFGAFESVSEADAACASLGDEIRAQRVDVVPSSHLC